MTDKNIRRGIFASVPELIASIESYMNAHNDNPKPYVWKATAESILAKIARARATLEQVANQFRDTPLAYRENYQYPIEGFRIKGYPLADTLPEFDNLLTRRRVEDIIRAGRENDLCLRRAGGGETPTLRESIFDRNADEVAP